jgi:phosphoserine phosphatase
MGTLGISTLFQTEDVFNKKKRILLFDIYSSFMDQQTLLEILELAGVPVDEFNATYGGDDPQAVLSRAAGCLEDLPLEVATNVTQAIQVAPGTVELIQTLKIMGYKIALVSRGFTCVSEILKEKLGIDYCFGVPLVENDDAMTATGELEDGALQSLDREGVIAHLAEREGVSPEDITIVTDQESRGGTPPGLRLEFDKKVLLDYYNKHILSRESLIGLLGSFGIPASASGEGY